MVGGGAGGGGGGGGEEGSSQDLPLQKKEGDGKGFSHAERGGGEMVLSLVSLNLMRGTQVLALLKGEHKKFPSYKGGGGTTSFTLSRGDG